MEADKRLKKEYNNKNTIKKEGHEAKNNKLATNLTKASSHSTAHLKGN